MLGNTPPNALDACCRSRPSGALLGALDPAEVPAAMDRLCGRGIPSAHIGEIVPAGQGRTLTEGDRTQPLPTFARDELARYLERA